MRIFYICISLLIIVSISASLASGLSLTASTEGNNGVRSSTHITYGATIDDFANQHIKINPEAGALSNDFSGTGDLPLDSIRIEDSKGNFATAWRMVSGKPGVTSWNYDWNTYIPYSSTAGSGVGVYLTLSVAKANSLWGGSAGSNSEGDYTSTMATGNSPTGVRGVSVNNMFTYTDSFINEVHSSISANSGKANSNNGKGASDMTFHGFSLNTEGDNSWHTIDVYGTASYPGRIYNPYIEADAQKSYTDVSGTADTSYGATADIISHAENLAQAYDPSSGSYNAGGSADFEAQKTKGNKFTTRTVEVTATGSSVIISPTGFSKTALLLEPFKWEFGDLYGTVGSALEKKGYAVTDYSNSGVSWNNVYQLGKSTVSLVDTHGVATEDNNGNIIYEFGLAISQDIPDHQKAWAQLQPYLMDPNDKGKNDLMILDGCGTFFKNPYEQLSGRDVVKNAKVSGGFKNAVSISTDLIFMKKFFARLCAGDTVSAANAAATKAVTSKQTLSLQGNTAYKLK